MTTPRRKVLLVSPPWIAAYEPSLALATFVPMLADSGIDCDTLYGSMLFPYADREQRLSTGSLGLPPVFLDVSAMHFFSACLFDALDAEAAVDSVIRRVIGVLNAGHLRPTPLTLAQVQSEERLRAELAADASKARVCIDRCVEAADRPSYDIVGLSTTFESQLPAALAIARRLKERRPEISIVIGGSACFGLTAREIVRSFPFVTAACHCEGDRVMIPLIEALRNGGDLAQVPGLVFRRSDGSLHRTPAPPLVVDLDELPIPRYDDFLEQLEASEWRGDRPRLYFETSRGCWWGQKHLCSFCGFFGVGLQFRRKSPDRAVAEIEALYRSYPSAGLLYATDSILDVSYLKTVFPRLKATPREGGRPLSLFFETKSNLRRDQTQLLAEAGVAHVQPGIESLSDDVLRIMDKGATGLQQIQFIKWAHEAGIEQTWNLLVRNPGETVESYRGVVEMLPYLEHLPPPTNVTPVMLHRFSPYHQEPERFGIRDVRPQPYYRDVYPDPAVRVEDLAYQFDYDHDMFDDVALTRLLRELCEAVHTWRRIPAGRRRQLTYMTLDRSVLVFERRAVFERRTILTNVAARLFVFLDRVHSEQAVLRRFGALDPDVARAAFDVWSHRRWLARDASGRLLSVVPRAAAPGGARGAATDPPSAGAQP